MDREENMDMKENMSREEDMDLFKASIYPLKKFRSN